MERDRKVPCAWESPQNRSSSRGAVPEPASRSPRPDLSQDRPSASLRQENHVHCRRGPFRSTQDQPGGCDTGIGCDAVYSSTRRAPPWAREAREMQSDTGTQSQTEVEREPGPAEGGTHRDRLRWMSPPVFGVILVCFLFPC